MSDKRNTREPSDIAAQPGLWTHATIAANAPQVHRYAEVKKLRHDARGALNQILGYAEMLIEDAEDEELVEERQELD